MYFLGVLTFRTIQTKKGLEKIVDPEMLIKKILIFKSRFWIIRWFVYSYLILVVILFLRYGIKDIQYFRFYFTSFFGGVKLVVILTSLVYVYTAYLMVTFFKNKSRLVILELILIIIIVSLLGSRTYPFIILIMGVVLANITGAFSNKAIFISGLIAVFFLISIRFITIQKLPPKTYKWYVENGIVNPNSKFESVLNLTTLTFRNIMKRNDMIFLGVPENFPFLKGKSFFFQFYALLKPGKQVNPHIALNHDLFKGSDTDVAYPPTILSQFYLDFGWIGHVIGGFCLGFAFQWLYYRFLFKLDFGSLLSYLFFNYAAFISLYGAFPLFNVLFVFCIGLTFNYKLTLKNKRLKLIKL